MYNWQWWGLRRYKIIYWRNKGFLSRSGSWSKRMHFVKLVTRNCRSGKKSKALSLMLKSFQLIHVFINLYAKKARSQVLWKRRRWFFFSLNDFFFFNRPFFTKKIKIRKKQSNKFTQYQVWEKKMPMELFKWFWLSSFCQPFKKVYQRFAFILLDFIFFTHNNLFQSLIQKVNPITSEDKFNVKKKSKKFIRQKFNKFSPKITLSYIGKINRY